MKINHGIYTTNKTNKLLLLYKVVDVNHRYPQITTWFYTLIV